MGKVVRNCRLCKETMPSSPFMLCSTCLTEMGKVQNYLRTRPRASVQEVSLSANVPQEKIEKMIKLFMRYRTTFDGKPNAKV
ncbi:hypothetical protein [Lentibacillus sediminis]|uniref:hypothetical protein n=1 Tax=Lentibacillus sediminis TaxID=1940529 RepID=UPI000C1BACE9|nr:hypothetical protein [Lentibacillus sediminis]